MKKIVAAGLAVLTLSVLCRLAYPEEKGAGGAASEEETIRQNLTEAHENYSRITDSRGEALASSRIRLYREELARLKKRLAEVRQGKKEVAEQTAFDLRRAQGGRVMEEPQDRRFVVDVLEDRKEARLGVLAEEEKVLADRIQEVEARIEELQRGIALGDIPLEDLSDAASPGASPGVQKDAERDLARRTKGLAEEVLAGRLEGLRPQPSFVFSVQEIITQTDRR